MLDIMYDSGGFAWLCLTANIITIILLISCYFVDYMDDDLGSCTFCMVIITIICWPVAIYHGPNHIELYYIILSLHAWLAYVGGLLFACVMKFSKAQHSTNPQEGTIATVSVVLAGPILYFLLDFAKGWII